MAGFLKIMRDLYHNSSSRGRERFILIFFHHRRLLISSTIVMLYALSQITNKVLIDSESNSFERLGELEPLVTVIVTIYNVEPFVQTAILAVLSQTHQNLEVIVVNDASSDESIRKSKEVSGDDKRVKYLSLHENSLGGVGIPTNIALDHAKGKYIALVDGDDFPAVDFISRMVRASQKLDLDICVCRFRSFEDSAFSSKEEYDLLYWPNPKIVAKSQSMALDPIEIPNIFRLSPEPWRKLYKREFLEENNIRFPEGDFLFEDNAFHWFVLKQAKRVSFIDDELVWHRQNRRGQTTELKRADRNIHLTMVRNSTEARKVFQKGNYVLATKYLARASHFLNIYSVGQDIKKCEERMKYCMIARNQFLMWIYRHKWLVALVESLENEKTWRKFASIYLHTLSYWSKQFKSSSLEIPPRKRRVPQKISKAGANSIQISVVVYCLNVERIVSARKIAFEHKNDEVEFLFLEDNSDDATLEKLYEIEERLDRVHVMHTSGRGFGRACNFAMPLCEGRYVAFLDYVTFTDSTIMGNIILAAKSYIQDVIVFQRREPQKHGDENIYRHNWGRKTYKKNSLGVRQIRFVDDMSRVLDNGAKLRSSLSKDGSIIAVVRRELILQKSIFYGGIGFEDSLQFNWHVLLSSESIKIIQIMRKPADKEDYLEDTTSVTKCPFRTLDVLLKANRVLVKNGITKDRAYHEDWKIFCAKRIAEGKRSFSKYNITQYNRDASLALEVITSHKDKIHVQ